MYIQNLIVIIFISLLTALIIMIILVILKKKKKKKYIDIGILFTKKGGPMEQDEVKLYAILNEYIKYYNKIQKKRNIKTVEYNPKSSTDLYKKGAQYLIDKNVSIIFGCWRTIDRKAIKPLVEKYNHLLCYPLQYEGNECSKNIIYFGSCPNQQIDIGIDYGIKNISKKIILIGSDYQFPRIANKIIKEYIKQNKCQLLEEIYVSLDQTDFDKITNRICKKYNSDRYLIINTINGDGNKYFIESLYHHYQKSIEKENKKILFQNRYSIMSFSLTESYCKNIKKEAIYGSYFTWNFSQTDKSYNSFLKNEYTDSINSKMNQKFRSSSKHYDDPEYHVFLSFLFFIEFLEDYDGPITNKDIREDFLKFRGERVLTPTGYLQIENNNHISQPVYILRLNDKNRFETIFKTNTEIYPNPWYLKYSKDKYYCDNTNFLGSKFLDNSIMNEISN